ncbi:MAG: superoxide dismutase family protein, partial [Gammaproteobacteria bacterium]|nr:superoxide dismutase family protein [Gammaproteobacteria bacterium]
MKRLQTTTLRGVAAATLICLPALVGADSHGLKATAEIKGCTDPNISGTATLMEKTSAEGIKEVTVKMMVEGLTDGKHAVHIHEVGAC